MISLTKKLLHLGGFLSSQVQQHLIVLPFPSLLRTLLSTKSTP